jgi:nucleoside-diphosphate-sugar epimerase
MRVFLAGATGAIGGRLIKELVAHGHQVTASTRNRAKFEAIRAAGAEPVAMDGLNAAIVGETVARARPDAIIHQMTALSGTPDLRHFDRWFETTNELRTLGTEHLLAAACAIGVRRFIAQSYTGWNNVQSGGPVKTEADGFDPNPARAQRESLAAIESLERAVLNGGQGRTVLRYGSFYGPGGSESLLEMIRKRQMPIVGDGAGVWSWIHLDDAAHATVRALENDVSGAYNIVDDEPAPVSEWLPFLAQVLGAKPPIRVPTWFAHLVAGEVPTRMLTRARGASNEKAKRDFGLELTWRTWRDGFRHGLGLRADAA